jgi:DNA polymerase-3 subunit gamma/tau
MSYLALARKWRPRRFEDVAGQPHVVAALANALDHNRVHHAYLFTGTRGVGKTTLARLLAKALNCTRGVSSRPCNECDACRAVDEGRFLDLIEVDAASRTKVEETRELLDNVQYAPTLGRYKVYLIDEVHMLSGHSFNALLKTLEEPPPHVKFLLATTDPQKLPVTVLSRCLQFPLKLIPADTIRERLRHVLTEEAVAFEPAALELLARAAAGSLRDALSLLDQAIAHGGGRVAEEAVRAMLGTIDDHYVERLVLALAHKDGEEMLRVSGEMTERAPDFDQALEALLRELYILSLAQTVPALVEARGAAKPWHAQALQALSPEDVQLFYQIALTGKRDLVWAPDPQTGFEMSLLRMLAFRPDSGPARIAVPVPFGVHKPEQSAQPAAAVPVTITTGSPVAAALPTDNASWIALADCLPVSGLVRELAMNSAFVDSGDSNLNLVVSRKHAFLANEERRAALTAALEAHAGRKLRLAIAISESVAETAASIRNREERERQQDSERAIKEDPNVRELMQRFGATIVPDTIRPNE